MNNTEKSGLLIRTFLVKDILLSNKTSYSDNLLKISKKQIVEIIKQDSRINGVKVDIAKPGESTRITAIKDVIEPRIKIDGPGQVYPGIDNRDITTVGNGITNRMSGIGITLISPVKSFELSSPASSAGGGSANNLIDMSGPGAEYSPYGKIKHLCLWIDVDNSLHLDDQNWAIHSAVMRVNDYIASLTKKIIPDEEQFFPDTSKNYDLNNENIAYIACMNSPQHYSNSLTAYGVGIYGVTMQTTPWVLKPTEILDGAISGAYSWEMVNNPILLNLFEKHIEGKINFKCVIAIRSRWSLQSEKNLTANQTSRILRDLNCKGAIVSWDAGGNDFVEVSTTIKSCENAGIKTVLITGEEHSDSDGPGLLDPVEEISAIVSTGVGSNMWYEKIAMPPVKKVIGPKNLQVNSGPDSPLINIPAKEEIPSLQLEDHFGFSYRSCFGF